MEQLYKTFENIRYSFYECDIYEDHGVLKVIGRDPFNDLVALTLDQNHEILNVV